MLIEINQDELHCVLTGLDLFIFMEKEIKKMPFNKGATFDSPSVAESLLKRLEDQKEPSSERPF